MTDTAVVSNDDIQIASSPWVMHWISKDENDDVLRHAYTEIARVMNIATDAANTGVISSILDIERSVHGGDVWIISETVGSGAYRGAVKVNKVEPINSEIYICVTDPEEAFNLRRALLRLALMQAKTPS